MIALMNSGIIDLTNIINIMTYGGVLMDYVLQISDLTKKIDKFSLEGINFSLEPGFIMGLIGPNGAGKTILVQSILGLYQVTEGSIRICGYVLKEQEKLAKMQVGFVLEDNPFPESLSSLEQAKMYGRCFPEWDMDKFGRYCSRFELDIKKPLKKLSKGNRMIFQLAFALSHNAKLLVFDEPSSGLDPVFRRELMEIMSDVISDGERSILYSTHLTGELDQLADYITFLQNGKQIFSLSKEDVMRRYCLVRGTVQQISSLEDGLVIGRRIGESQSEALVRKDIIPLPASLQQMRPTIEDILCYTVSIL